MLFLDIVGCTESSGGIWIVRRDGVFFVQVLQTFPGLIIVWSTTCCWRFVHIHKVPGILLVWHRLRDYLCYWPHLSVVGTPGTECVGFISLLFTGIPTKLKKKLSPDIGSSIKPSILLKYAAPGISALLFSEAFLYVLSSEE